MTFERPSSSVVAPTGSVVERARQSLSSGAQMVPRSRARKFEKEHPGQLLLAIDYSHRSPLLKPGDIAEKFGLSDNQVRKLCDQATLISFHINVADQPAREHLRIHRQFVLGQTYTLSGIVDLWRSVPSWLLSYQRQILNVADVAFALNISGDTVRLLHDAGVIPGHNTAVKTASLEHLRFHRDALIHFVRTRLALKHGLTEKDVAQAFQPAVPQTFSLREQTNDMKKVSQPGGSR